MVKLYDAETDKLCGTLNDEQFRQLAEAMEEESSLDRDYYLSRDTVEMLEEEGADPGLIGVLRAALGDRDDMDIRWEKG